MLVTFKLSPNSLISGWFYGLKGMKVNGKMNLLIPSDLAYGSSSKSPSNDDYSDIPEFSTLHFEIKLLDVIKHVE